MLLFCYYAFVRDSKGFDPVDHAWELAMWITISFVFGAICSVIAGYVGMWVSIRSNIRTAHAALTSLNDALRVALRGGAVSGLLVTCMSLLGVAGLFGLVSLVTDVDETKITASDHRLWLRRFVRGPVCPAGRRYLYQGR